jgi:hypothetical protein
VTEEKPGAACLERAAPFVYVEPSGTWQEGSTATPQEGDSA